MKKRILAVVCTISIVLGCCFIATAAENFINDMEMITVVSPENGAEIVLANDLVNKYYSDYLIGINNMPKYEEQKDKYFPNEIVFSWEIEEPANCYNVKLSFNEDMSDAEIMLTNNPCLKLTNLQVGRKYYWQVEAVYTDKIVRSVVHKFTTAETPRTLYIDGVSNTRDFGGWIVSKTQRIKQDMIYRGAKLDNITNKGLENALYDYRIKTDLDLRNSGEELAGTASVLGVNVNYINIGLAYYTHIYEEKNYTALANAIKVFANKDNYPIYFHCSLGRDRTGSLAFVLGGLLGKSRDQLYMDYELSFISYMGVNDSTPYSSMLHTFTAMYNGIASYADGSFYENMEQFVLDIGVTEEEIASIRSIMLEEVK